MPVLERSRPWAIFVYVEANLKRSIKLHIVTYTKLLSYCAMSKVLSHQPRTKEDRLPSQSSQCRVCDGQSGTGTYLFHTILIFCVSIILPALYNHIHLKSTELLNKKKLSGYL